VTGVFVLTGDSTLVSATVQKRRRDADDQRFVMIQSPNADKVIELILVENFFEELKAKVGN
jgi:hypothetical protein